MKKRAGVLLTLVVIAAAAAASEGPSFFLRANGGANYESAATRTDDEKKVTPYGGAAVGFKPIPYVAIGGGFDLEGISTDYPDEDLKSSYSVALHGWGFLPLGKWQPQLHGRLGRFTYTYETFASRRYIEVTAVGSFAAIAPGVSYALSRHLGVGGEAGVRWQGEGGYDDARTFYFGGAFAEFYL